MLRQHLEIDGANIVITGAGSGIGRSLAIRLSRMGANVALIDVNEKQLIATSDMCAGAIYDCCDITDTRELSRAIEEFARFMGGYFDVVIANAGVADEEPLMNDGTCDLFERAINVNVIGTHLTVKHAEPFVTKGGYIMVTSSLAASITLPLMVGYCVSKAGVSTYGNGLSLELRGSGIKSGIAYYSQIDNEMTEKFESPAGRWLLDKRKLRKLIHRPIPEKDAIDAVVLGIQRRSPKIFAPKRARYIQWFDQPINFFIGKLIGDPTEAIEISRASR